MKERGSSLPLYGTDDGRIPCAVVIPTKNEQANIVDCIASMLGDFESVYVVDSGSSDSTQALAKSSGALVLERIQQGPFDLVDQKNWALTQVESSSGWVLFMDADERAPTSFVQALRQFIHTDAQNFDVAYLAPKFMYQGTWLRQFMGFPNWHPRLVHKERTRLVGRVWKSIPDGARVAHVDEPYLHFANSKGLADWVERHVRYAQEEARLSAAEDVVGFDGKRRRERAIANKLGGFRPGAALVYHLILRRGVLDGGSVGRMRADS